MCREQLSPLLRGEVVVVRHLAVVEDGVWGEKQKRASRKDAFCLCVENALVRQKAGSREASQ